MSRESLISATREPAIRSYSATCIDAACNSFYSMMGNWASLTRGEGFVRKPVYDDTAVSRALEASEAYGIPASYDKKAAEALMEREGMFRKSS